MAIENPVSNDFYLRSSIVLKFRIAAYPVNNFLKYLKDIQLIFIASYRMTNEPRPVISNNVAFRHEYTQTSLCSLLLSLEIHFFSVGLSCDIIVQSKAFITGFWF